jgi:tetratricopeptide (TPR) repeat protein
MRAKTIIITLVLLAVAIGWWFIRLDHQNEVLKQAEQSVTNIMQLIDRGQLNAASQMLSSVDNSISPVRRQWAALPSIRTKEQTITSHLHNITKANADKAALTEQVALKLISLAQEGKLTEAETALQKGLETYGRSDENYASLSTFIARLKVQDFKTSEQTAKQIVAQLPNNIPLSSTGRTALPSFTNLVEREKRLNFAAHERIASEVKSLIDLSRSTESSEFKPALKGKAMIWDATKKNVEMAYELLPDNLRASSRDGVVTIFSIMRRENILMGYYSISHQPGYKEKMVIGVVYWPAKINAGTAVVWGGDPPGTRPVQYVPGYGSSVNIKDWISSLPTK